LRKKKKILVLNDYNLENDIKLHRSGKLPAHLTFGLPKLEQLGFDCELIRLWEPGFLYHADNFLIRHKPFIPIGRLESQVKALRRVNRACAILSLKETESNLLHYMRAIGLIEIPVITLVHHSQDIGRFARLRAPFYRLWNKGADAVLTFSERVKLVNANNSKKVTIRWGPDIPYYDSLNPSYGKAIVTSGRSGRDFDTFASACIKNEVPARIYCTNNDLSERLTNLPNFINCEVGWQTPQVAIAKQKDSLAIAIPLHSQPFTSGLTSLCDAFGFGKAILMPDNPGIDFDIEGLGIGKVVSPNNLSGWNQTLQWVKEHPEKIKEMGKRAKSYARKHYNSDIFVEQVAKVLLKSINH
jgi:glycosyltransferase involved in cell wall biosynthesis